MPGFATRAIHEGQEPDPATGAVVVPIYQTATFAQEELGKHKGYKYARGANPTRTALERNLAALEGGRGALAFASGMAAINAVMTLLSQGDHVIATENMYGGTIRLFDAVLKRFGIGFTYVDTSGVENLEPALRPTTRMLYVETPSNPLMALTDLCAAAQWAKGHGLRLAVDNTFMSPYFQRPIALGADFVVHSTTKYLNGHSDSIGGAVVLANEDDLGPLRFVQNAAGAILSPFDSWLVLRGVKTLAVRMRQHSENALELACWLGRQRKVKQVHYPGLPEHPHHQLARRQMSGFGGMLSFDLGSLEAARRFLREVRLCSLGESLGGVETLIAHPATMSHAYLSPEERARLGIGDGLVRLSVGIENIEDLIADLERALEAV